MKILYEDSIFDSQAFWSPEEEAKKAKEKSRVIAIRRAIRAAEQAVEKAQAAGDNATAEALRKRIGEFNDLIDGIVSNDSDEPEAEGSSSENNTNQSSSKEADDELDKDIDSESEEDSDKDSSKDTEKSSKNKNSDSNEDEEDTSGDNDNIDDGLDFGSEEEKVEKQNKSEGSAENSDASSKPNTRAEKNNSDKDSPEEGASGLPQDQNDESNEQEDSEEEQEETSTTTNSNKQQKDNSQSETSKQDSTENEENPFEIDVNNTSPASSTQQNKPKDPSIETIIKILKETSGDGRKGVNQALRDILAQRGIDVSDFLGEALVSLPKGKQLIDWSDEEFSDVYNNFLDEITKYRKLKLEDPEKQAERVQQIQQDLSNPMIKRGLASEDNVEIQKDVQAVKAREKEKRLYQGGNVKSFDAFKLNFWRAIKDQVADLEQEEETYFRINQQYEGEGVFKKGNWNIDLPSLEKPVVNLYFDVSASWGDETDIKAGDAAVALMSEFDRQNEIQLNIIYFTNGLYNTREEAMASSRGTWAWAKILQNIKATKARNVVLMTDDDMSGQADAGPTCVVDGHVWFLWKNKSSRCPEIISHLKGKQGASEYTIQ